MLSITSVSLRELQKSKLLHLLSAQGFEHFADKGSFARLTMRGRRCPTRCSLTRLEDFANDYVQGGSEFSKGCPGTPNVILIAATLVFFFLNAWNAMAEVFSDDLNLKIGDLLSHPLYPATSKPCARPFMLMRPIQAHSCMFAHDPV
jgi:hypothetical protein